MNQDDILKQLLQEIKQLNEQVSRVGREQAGMRHEQLGMKESVNAGFSLLSDKMEIVYTQTAANSEELSIIQDNIKRTHSKLDTVILQTGENAELTPRVEQLENFVNGIKSIANQ